MFLYDGSQFEKLFCMRFIRLHEIHLGLLLLDCCAEEFLDDHLLDGFLQFERGIGFELFFSYFLTSAHLFIIILILIVFTITFIVFTIFITNTIFTIIVITFLSTFSYTHIPFIFLDFLKLLLDWLWRWAHCWKRITLRFLLLFRRLASLRLVQRCGWTRQCCDEFWSFELFLQVFYFLATHEIRINQKINHFWESRETFFFSTFHHHFFYHMFHILTHKIECFIILFFPEISILNFSFLLQFVEIETFGVSTLITLDETGTIFGCTVGYFQRSFIQIISI